MAYILFQIDVMSEQKGDLQEQESHTYLESPNTQENSQEVTVVPEIVLHDTMPALAINGESIEEPITPTPTDLSIISSSTTESTLPDDSESSTTSHSTYIPESINDDLRPFHIDEHDFQGPVIESFKNKNILMTGATGFIGKAILWKLIQALRQDLGNVYILIRSGSIKRSKIGRPSERLRNEIFNNKVKYKSKKKEN